MPYQIIKTISIMEKRKRELYQIILNRYIQESKESHEGSAIGRLFICNIIQYCFEEGLMTANEYENIITDFKLNKPTAKLHKEFYDGDFWFGGFCWWSLNEKWLIEQVKVRINFIEKLIEIN